MDSSSEAKNFDAVIVGGGPGGLSAALVLGRACKKVLVCDAGPRRNALATHLHGFVTRDGTPPEDFRRIAREQLAPYDVTFRAQRVSAVRPAEGKFVVTLEDGRVCSAQKVVLAMGVLDQLPELPGLREAWGHSAFQCPHCHGWERRNQRWGVLIPSQPMFEHALVFTGWTKKLVAFTHGAFKLSPETEAKLSQAGVQVETRSLKRLDVGPGGQLLAAETTDERRIPLDALFTMPAQALPPLVHALGVALHTEGMLKGFVQVNDAFETSIPGLYAVGDLTTPAQAAMVAAYGGAKAAWTMIVALNAKGHPDSRQR